MSEQYKYEGRRKNENDNRGGAAANRACAGHIVSHIACEPACCAPAQDGE